MNTYKGFNLDYQVIKDLIKIMDKAKLSKLSVREKNGFEVCLEKHQEGGGATKHHFHAAPQHTAPQEEVKAAPAKASGHFLKSPMVGTFYTAPSPQDPPFVKVGDRVEKGQVICIVEAMKVMNEVKADRGGTIKEICVENMQPVEFGTNLFGIE